MLFMIYAIYDWILYAQRMIKKKTITVLKKEDVFIQCKMVRRFENEDWFCIRIL